MARTPAFLRPRPAVELLLGMCVGLAITMIFSPVVEDLCYNVTLNTTGIALETYSDTQATGAAKKLARPVRPRFVSTELGIREKIYFAILTTTETLETRANAINTTINSHTLKLAYFLIDAKMHSGPIQSHLPLVAFDGDKTVTDALWFQSFKYVGDKYLNTFDWFFFVPDSVYVSASNIVNFVERISVAGTHLVGKPGKQNGASTCDPSIGVLMSHNVFAALLRSLSVCSKKNKSVYSGTAAYCFAHVTRALNITCLDAINEMVFNYYFNKSLDVALDLKVLGKKNALNRMMTVGLLTDSVQFYLLHRHIAEEEIVESRKQLAKVNAEIERVTPLTPDGNNSFSWPPGVYDATKPKTRFDVLRWHYFTDTHIYGDSDFTNYRELKGVDKEDITDIVNVAMTRLSQKDRIQYKFLRIVNGYRRFDAARGTDYVMDLAYVDPRDKKAEIVQRVELVRPLGAIEIIPTPYVTETTKIQLILPVTMHERDAVLAFLDSYSRVCVESGDNANLLIVLIYPDKIKETAGKDDEYVMIKSTISFYESKFKRSMDPRINWTSIHARSTLSVYEAVMASRDNMDAVLRRLAPESLVFVCSVGMELSVELLNRVRMNTILNFQVFFPVAFWAYKPNLIYDKPPYPATIDISPKTGRFDPKRFDHVSFYCADYTAARQMASQTGYSQSVLFDLFVWYQPNIHVLRGVEPALKIHYREEVECALPEKEKTSHCPSPRLPASQSQLAMLVLEYQQRLDRQQIDVMHKQRGENVDQMKPDMI